MRRGRVPVNSIPAHKVQSDVNVGNWIQLKDNDFQIFSKQDICLYEYESLKSSKFNLITMKFVSFRKTTPDSQTVNV